jgi:hypothetical protein
VYWWCRWALMSQRTSAYNFVLGSSKVLQGSFRHAGSHDVLMWGPGIMSLVWWTDKKMDASFSICIALCSRRFFLPFHSCNNNKRTTTENETGRVRIQNRAARFCATPLKVRHEDREWLRAQNVSCNTRGTFSAIWDLRFSRGWVSTLLSSGVWCHAHC